MALTRHACVLALLAAGCGPQTVHTASPSSAAPTSVRRAEDDWTRHRIPAEGLQVHATLWDAEIVASALASGKTGVPDGAWSERFLKQTAFTVVVELEDRQPVLDPTPFLRAEGWSFGLKLNKGDGEEVLAPSSVDLLVVDRFPTLGGGHHHRVAMMVAFDGPLHDVATRSESIDLVVKAVEPPSEGRARSMLGRRLSRRGTHLRWRLQPS
ncbi:MAG: hypothetical protein AAGA54_25255 [Myxococcota bacterium]